MKQPGLVKPASDSFKNTSWLGSNSPCDSRKGDASLVLALPEVFQLNPLGGLQVILTCVQGMSLYVTLWSVQITKSTTLHQKLPR